MVNLSVRCFLNIFSLIVLSISPVPTTKNLTICFKSFFIIFLEILKKGEIPLPLVTEPINEIFINVSLISENFFMWGYLTPVKIVDNLPGPILFIDKLFFTDSDTQIIFLQ